LDFLQTWPGNKKKEAKNMKRKQKKTGKLKVVY